jgi:hypothetical protein
MQVGPPPAGSVIDDERRRFDHAACCIWRGTDHRACPEAFWGDSSAT